MKHKLPRPAINEILLLIMNREIKKQKLPVGSISKKNLKELADVSRAIERSGYPKHLVCKRLSQGLGKGIFLHPKAKPILKGQVIASYAGELSVVPQHEDDPDGGSYAFAPIEFFTLSKTEQILLDKKNRYHPRRLYELKLDALKIGNFTRYINHSDKPNVFADTVSIPSNSYGLAPSPIEIVYRAKKNIQPGEQLLISYEDGEESYWKIFNITPYPMTPQTFRLSPSSKLISVS